MFPPFPQELARHYCMELISGIEDGSILLKQISQESKERKGHGVMIGALVCVNSDGERVVLETLSGISVAALRQAQGPRGVGESVEPPLKKSSSLQYYHPKKLNKRLPRMTRKYMS